MGDNIRKAFKKKSTLSIKIMLFSLSMWLFYLIIFIASVHVPIYFGTDAEFVGFEKLWMLNGWAPVLSCLMLILNAWFLYKFIYHIKGSSDDDKVIMSLQNKDFDSSDFLASHLIPLCAFFVPGDRNFLIMIILFLVIAVIYIRSDLYHLNPTLLFLGFHIYEVKTQDNVTMVLIARAKFEEGESFKYLRISDCVNYATKLKSLK